MGSGGRRPAVLQSSYCGWLRLLTTKLHAAWSCRPMPDGSVNPTYYNSAEHELSLFGTYYAIPQLSLKAAVYQNFLNDVPGFSVTDQRHRREDLRDHLFYHDPHHPSGRTGARCAGLTVCFVLLVWRGRMCVCVEGGGAQSAHHACALRWCRVAFENKHGNAGSYVRALSGKPFLWALQASVDASRG